VSGPFIDDVAEHAMAALRQDDPDKALTALTEALDKSPDRVDLLNALAVTHLRMGESIKALEVLERAEAIAYDRRDETAAMMMPQITLTKAAAAEDAQRPAVAEAAYRELLAHEEGNPRARSGLAYLLLAWGRTQDGIDELRTYLEHEADEPQFLGATKDFLAAVRSVLDDDVHPKEFVAAHRGSYVQFFDEHAEKLVAEGWIAEAARMHRTPNGDVVHSVPEGARPYAAIRVDLVNPETHQPGLVGDRPVVVALANYEPLARGTMLLSWPARDFDYPAWISTQAPWNHLPITIRFEDPEADAVSLLDGVIETWYTAGFNGDFGSADRGRFHEVTDIAEVEPGVAQVHVDCGRAEAEAVVDLLRRFDRLHDEERIASVLIGRGYVPVGADPDNEADAAYD